MVEYQPSFENSGLNRLCNWLHWVDMMYNYHCNDGLVAVLILLCKMLAYKQFAEIGCSDDFIMYSQRNMLAYSVVICTLIVICLVMFVICTS